MPDLASIVGRGAALERVRPLLDGLAGGSGGVVLVSGEPGIGKTRFTSELADQLAIAGANVAWGCCQEITTSQAYRPWLEALRSLVDQSLLQELLPKPMWARMGRLFPEFEGLSDGDHADRPDESQIVLIDALRQLLTALAERQPISIVLEDVHWSDDGSLRLVEFLAPDLAAHPIELLLTYREQEALDHATLRDVVGGLSSLPNVQRVALDRLTAEGTRGLLEMELDDPTSIDAAMVEAVHRRTAGNPFFIRQVAQMLNLPDSASGDLAAVPPAVQDVIERRLNRLSAETRQYLEAVAVCGWEFRPAMAREVDSFEVDPAILLEDAERRGFIEADPAVRLGYRFVHHLVWEAVYGAISPVRRARLHARVAEQLERTSPADRDERLSMIASHLERSGDAAEPGHALELFVDAGEQALDRQALESARRWFGYAVELAEQQHLSQALLGLRARLGQALCDTRLGDTQSSIDRLERIAYQGLECGDPVFIGDSVFEFIRYWGPFTGYLDPDMVTPLIDRALEAVDDEAAAPRARLMLCRAYQLFNSGQPDHLEEARALAEQAIGTARKSGSDAVLADVLSGSHIVWWEPRFADVWTEHTSEAAELCRKLDRVEELVSILGWGFYRRFEAGELVVPESERAELDRLILRSVSSTGASYRTWHEAGAMALGGDIDRARALLKEEERGKLHETRGSFPYRRVSNWLSLARHDGTIGQLRERLRTVWDQPPPVEGTTLDADRAFRHLIEGDIDDAVSDAYRVIDSGFTRFEMDQDRPGALAMMAEVAFEAGDVEMGQAVYPELRALNGIVPSPMKGFFGSTWRHLGLLSRLVGEPERAREEFGRALEANGGFGPSIWTGLTQADYADLLTDLLTEVGDPDDAEHARELYRTAAEIAERQGAAVLVERCRVALAGDVGAVARVELPDGLTRREAEIIRLIARGMTNNEIAAELVLSVRTVERHVTNAYGKIGARGRADATAYVLKAGLEAGT